MDGLEGEHILSFLYLKHPVQRDSETCGKVPWLHVRDLIVCLFTFSCRVWNKDSVFANLVQAAREKEGTQWHHEIVNVTCRVPPGKRQHHSTCLQLAHSQDIWAHLGATRSRDGRSVCVLPTEVPQGSERDVNELLDLTLRNVSWMKDTSGTLTQRSEFKPVVIPWGSEGA